MSSLQKRRLRKTGRSDYTRFVKLDLYVLKSPAWQHLSLPARCLLIEVWQRFNGSNNGEISYSTREAATRLRIGRNRPTLLFRELDEKGFLKANERGAFTRKNRMATTWILTAEEYNGQPAAKEFMRWQPGSGSV